MNSTILTSEVIKNLQENNVLQLTKRRQKNTEQYNYYIVPNLAIQLFKPKVLFVTQKYIVFQYNKFETLTLYKLLENINNLIKFKLKDMTRTDIKTVYDLYSITDNDNMTIRCNLPQKNNKYFIQYIDTFTNAERHFYLPKKDTFIDSVIIELRNLWETDDKIGFNLELKLIKN